MTRIHFALNLLCMAAALLAFTTAARAMGEGNKSCVSSMSQIQASASGTSQAFYCSTEAPNLSYVDCRPTQQVGGPGHPTGATCKVWEGATPSGVGGFEAQCYKHPADTSFTTTCTVDYDCCE
jgi:hypothetical protein